MKKVFILFVVVWLTACSSGAQYNNHIFVDNNDIEEISYFLNRLECHDMFDKCVTKNFDMYISKNNDTLVMQNSDNKIIIFNYNQVSSTIQLNQGHETYFFKSNPQDVVTLEENKKIMKVIGQARSSLGYDYD